MIVARTAAPEWSGPSDGSWLGAFESIQNRTAEAHAVYQQTMAQCHIAFLRTAESSRRLALAALRRRRHRITAQTLRAPRRSRPPSPSPGDDACGANAAAAPASPAPAPMHAPAMAAVPAVARPAAPRPPARRPRSAPRCGRTLRRRLAPHAPSPRHTPAPVAHARRTPLRPLPRPRRRSAPRRPRPKACGEGPRPPRRRRPQVVPLLDRLRRRPATPPDILNPRETTAWRADLRDRLDQARRDPLGVRGTDPRQHRKDVNLEEVTKLNTLGDVLGFMERYADQLGFAKKKNNQSGE